jgi:putative spermidine/putrescine transport system permease protein
VNDVSSTLRPAATPPVSRRMAGGRPGRRHGPAFWLLAGFFALFVLFLYGPTITIVVLSFQGPSGGLTFPMNGVSLHWFANLFEKQMVGDFAGSFRRSIILGLVVMVVTVIASFSAGLAFRTRFKGSAIVFYLAIASLIVPSILISLGIGLLFRVLDIDTSWYTSAFGAHLTWTLPFGLLIMFAVFNRFDRRYEEAARDLGATHWQTIRYVIVPILLPSLIGVGLFGFTLSYDEFARSLYTAGTFNTLPLEIYGMTTNVTTPVLYALGTVTTGLSFLVIALALASTLIVRRRRARHGSDAGKAA